MNRKHRTRINLPFCLGENPKRLRICRVWHSIFWALPAWMADKWRGSAYLLALPLPQYLCMTWPFTVYQHAAHLHLTQIYGQHMCSSYIVCIVILTTSPCSTHHPPSIQFHFLPWLTLHDLPFIFSIFLHFSLLPLCLQNSLIIKAIRPHFLMHDLALYDYMLLPIAKILLIQNNKTNHHYRHHSDLLIVHCRTKAFLKVFHFSRPDINILHPASGKIQTGAICQSY